ncbi:hypothetical protein [Dechloromonas sp. CZR5]|jgi:hypothetical protein|nr:hypothetical protein [Dechloromonas sp. CZR5]
MNKAFATSRSTTLRVAQTDEPGCAPVGLVPAKRIADIADIAERL